MARRIPSLPGGPRKRDRILRRRGRCQNSQRWDGPPARLWCFRKRVQGGGLEPREPYSKVSGCWRCLPSRSSCEPNGDPELRETNITRGREQTSRKRIEPQVQGRLFQRGSGFEPCRCCEPLKGTSFEPRDFHHDSGIGCAKNERIAFISLVVAGSNGRETGDGHFFILAFTCSAGAMAAGETKGESKG